MRPYYQDNLVTLYWGDCLDVMAELPAQSFDAIIADPPYGTTTCAWDTVISFELMWKAIKRLAKTRAAVVLFGSQPFTSALVMSNPMWFKYQWVWNKNLQGNPGLAQYQPLKVTEDITVFSRDTHNYYPQKTRGEFRQKGGPGRKSQIATGIKHGAVVYQNDEYFPKNILNFAPGRQDKLHPTQKPLPLLEYLVKTYTNGGDRVLDFTCGSGTALRACKNLKRECVGIELLEEYCTVTAHRLSPVFEAAIIDNGNAMDDLPLFAGSGS